jgi:hypothetical protein
VIRVAVVALAVLVAAGVVEWQWPGSSKVSSGAVEFALALRTFEDSGVTLADQAVAQSTSPAVQAEAAALTAHGNVIAAELWGLLDRWGVPGIDRLPPAAGAPAAVNVLHHDCTVYVNDELARLSVLNGAAFDQRFVSDWVGHATTALAVLDTGRVPDAPGLAGVVAAARASLEADLGALAR